MLKFQGTNLVIPVDHSMTGSIPFPSGPEAFLMSNMASILEMFKNRDTSAKWDPIYRLIK